MAVRDDMLRALSNRHTRRIRFSFPMVVGGQISGDNTTFTRVHTAIQNGHVAITERRNLRPDEAAYFDRGPAGTSGEFEVSRWAHRSRLWESSVVHEAVHASLDLVRSPFSKVDTEAAAFLASAMYMVLSGLPANRFQGTYQEIVRSTAIQALDTGIVDMAGINRLWSALRGECYNDGIMVDGAGAWTSDQGDG